MLFVRLSCDIKSEPQVLRQIPCPRLLPVNRGDYFGYSRFPHVSSLHPQAINNKRHYVRTTMSKSKPKPPDLESLPLNIIANIIDETFCKPVTISICSTLLPPFVNASTVLSLVVVWCLLQVVIFKQKTGEWLNRTNDRS